MARSPKKATFQGVPTEKIAEAQTRWASIAVRMWRRVPSGRLSALGLVHMTPQELGNIEEYLKNKAGGGRFRVEPRNPDNLLQYCDPIPAFELEIEGAPKPATPAEHGLKAVAGGITAMEGVQTMQWQDPQQMQQQIEGLPQWMRSMPPNYIQAFSQGVNPSAVLRAMGEIPSAPAGQPSAPVAMYASDQLGVQQLQYTREQLTKERTERENDRKEWDRRFELMQQQMNEAKEQAREARERAEREKLEAKLEAMQSQKSSIDPTVWVGLATAFAPVLSAVVSSGQQKAAVQQEQATKAIELQMQGMNNLMQASTKKGGDLEGIVKLAVGLAPVLGPVLQKFAENRSPGAQADLFSTLAENNLTTLTTMGQFLQAMMEANGNDPWWRPMIESAVESVQQVGAQMAAAAGAKGPVVQQQVQQAQENGTRKPVSQGQQVASMIINSNGFPKELKTGAWFELLAAMHDQVDADQVAHHLSEHILHLALEDALPELLENVFDKPQEVLEMLLGPLPIKQQKPDYTSRIVRLTVHKLSTAMSVDIEGEGSDDVEADAAEGDGDFDSAPQAADSVPFDMQQQVGGGPQPQFA